MQSNHRIGKNRRAENPPALLYFALVKEVSVQSCFTSIWKRKCRCRAALLRFGKGSVCAVLLYFALVREVFVQFCFTSLWQRKFWCGSALLHFGKGSVCAVGTRGHFIPVAQSHVKAALGAAVLALAGLFSRMNVGHLCYLRIYSALRLRIPLLCLTVKILFG